MAARPRLVVVNAGRLDFDGSLSFEALAAVADLQRFDDSSPTPQQVAERAACASIIVTKEARRKHEPHLQTRFCALAALLLPGP